MRPLSIVLCAFLLFSCNKDPLDPRGKRQIVEGTVYKDCSGNTYPNEKIILRYASYKRVYRVISEEEKTTDSKGRYRFRFHEIDHNKSSATFGYTILFSDDSIEYHSPPEGCFDLYPNDTTMNALIHLKFNNEYSAKDTFYFAHRPAIRGRLRPFEHINYIPGPFKDTTILIKGIRISDITSRVEGNQGCGEFRWGWSLKDMSRNFTGRQGGFSFKHEPCSDLDEFEYTVIPE
jgi:hypothetical protein